MEKGPVQPFPTAAADRMSAWLSYVERTAKQFVTIPGDEREVFPVFASYQCTEKGMEETLVKLSEDEAIAFALMSQVKEELIKPEDQEDEEDKKKKDGENADGKKQKAESKIKRQLTKQEKERETANVVRNQYSYNIFIDQAQRAKGIAGLYEPDEEEYCENKYPEVDYEGVLELRLRKIEACVLIRTSKHVYFDSVDPETFKRVRDYVVRYEGMAPSFEDGKYIKAVDSKFELQFNEGHTESNKDFDKKYLGDMWKLNTKEPGKEVGLVLEAANYFAFISLCQLTGAKIAAEIQRAQEENRFEKMAEIYLHDAGAADEL